MHPEELTNDSDVDKSKAIWNAADSLRGKFAIEEVQIVLDQLLAKSQQDRDWSFREPHFNKKVAGLLQSIIFQLSANFGLSDLLVLNQTKEFIPDEIFESLHSQLSITHEKNRFGFREDFSEYGVHPFVIGLFGFQIQHTSLPKIESSLLQSIRLAKQIKEDGVGLFMFPGYANTFIRNEAVRHFSDLGLHVSAVIRTPKGFIARSTIQPLLVMVQKKSSDKTFVLDAHHYESLDLHLTNFFEQVDTGDIESGIWTTLSDFSGFEVYAAREQMAVVSQGFTNDYRELRITDVAVEVNLCKTGSSFTHLENSVYLPLIGNGATVCHVEDIQIKHQNYCQVVLDIEKILPKYLSNFLGSPYGRLRIEEAKSLGAGFIPKLNRAQILNMQIAVPSIETQQRTCDFVDKLTTLRNTVIEIEESVSLNPVMTKSLLPKVEEVLSVFNKLSVEDQIKSLIRKGETKEIEFKQTFVLDVRQGVKNKDMTTAVIKTIAGFLNTDGGELLVGVSDAGEILGVNEEMSKFYSNSPDKYLQNVKNAIKERIGEPSYPYIDYKLHEVDSALLLRVTCRRSDEPVYVDDRDFYVRTNPATDKLEGPKQLQYIRQRFG
jgi:hypothetical protein